MRKSIVPHHFLEWSPSMRHQLGFGDRFSWIVGALALAWSCCAAGQAYPTKPIRVIVAYPAGGPNDIVGRTVGQRVGEIIGANVVTENRSGAGGNIGTESVAKAAPDGYTLLMGAGAMSIAPAIYPKLGYDLVRDLAPISLAAVSSFLVLVHPGVPAKNVK